MYYSTSFNRYFVGILVTTIAGEKFTKVGNEETKLSLIAKN